MLKRCAVHSALLLPSLLLQDLRVYLQSYCLLVQRSSCLADQHRSYTPARQNPSLRVPSAT
jgi:hypothetical protein